MKCDAEKVMWEWAVGKAMLGCKYGCFSHMLSDPVQWRKLTAAGGSRQAHHKVTYRFTGIYTAVHIIRTLSGWPCKNCSGYIAVSSLHKNYIVLVYFLIYLLFSYKICTCSPHCEISLVSSLFSKTFKLVNLHLGVNECASVIVTPCYELASCLGCIPVLCPVFPE